jgi:hypothetical protein
MRLALILGIGLFAAHTAMAADSRLITTPEPPPPLLNEPNHQSDLQQPKPEERGTEQIPFVVKVVPSEPTPEAEIQSKEKSEFDRKLANFTGDLAFYTKCLFGATVFLALVTGSLALVAFFQMRDARKSITASEKLANAAVAHAGHAERAVDVALCYCRSAQRGHMRAPPSARRGSKRRILLQEFAP